MERQQVATRMADIAARLPRPAVVVVLVAVVLMVVIGWPAWRRHMIREHIGQALDATDALQLVVSEAATLQGDVSKVRAAGLSYNRAAISNPFVADAAALDGGIISLRTRATGADPDPVFTLTPTEIGHGIGARLVWTCRMVLGDPDVVPRRCAATPITR